MINFDKIESTAILTQPFEHLVCEQIFSDTSRLVEVYDHLSTHPEWNKEDEYDMSLYRLPVEHPTTNKLQVQVDEYNWRPLLKRMGVEYSKLVTSWQATKISHPLGPHTDEPEITGVVAKILIYLTPGIDCGTIVHNSDLTISKVTSGKLGDVFIFKTSPLSFHSTNYDHIDPDTRRVALVGCFHA
jgi:hypothetical protein